MQCLTASAVLGIILHDVCDVVGLYFQCRERNLRLNHWVRVGARISVKSRGVLRTLHRVASLDPHCRENAIGRSGWVICSAQEFQGTERSESGSVVPVDEGVGDTPPSQRGS